MRWSQLRKLLRELFDPALDLDVHCLVDRGAANVGRYRFTLNKEVVWEAPADAEAQLRAGQSAGDVSAMTVIMREYIETPRDELLSKRYPADHWGLAEVLRAADRRIGKRRLQELYEATYSQGARKIIEARLGTVA